MQGDAISRDCAFSSIAFPLSVAERRRVLHQWGLDSERTKFFGVAVGTSDVAIDFRVTSQARDLRVHSLAYRIRRLRYGILSTVDVEK